jgi:hypothetical protein
VHILVLLQLGLTLKEDGQPSNYYFNLTKFRMKSKLIISILFFSIVSFSSCKRENNSNGSHRVKQLTAFEQGAEVGKYAFTYSGSNLIKAEASDQGIITDKAEYSYSENKITLLSSSKDDNGNWISTYKEEYIYNGSNISQLNSYELQGDVWVQTDKVDYIFELGNLTQSIQESYQQSQTYYYKTTEIYNGTKISEKDKFYKFSSSDWVQYDKETFLWEGVKLMGWINYDYQTNGSWIESQKSTYTYDGNNKSQKSDFSKIDTEWSPDELVAYSYDGDGCLIEENYTDSKNVYVYEAGVGNISKLFYDPEDLVYAYPPIKSYSAAKERFLDFKRKLSRLINY